MSAAIQSQSTDGGTTMKKKKTTFSKNSLTKLFGCNIIYSHQTQCAKHGKVGVFSDEGPPVPIPNTAVKLISADNTWLEAAREDKAMPTQTAA